MADYFNVIVHNMLRWFDVIETKSVYIVDHSPHIHEVTQPWPMNKVMISLKSRLMRSSWRLVIVAAKGINCIMVRLQNSFGAMNQGCVAFLHQRNYVFLRQNVEGDQAVPSYF